MIRNRVNGKVYVGSASGQSIKQRLSVHRSQLVRGVHGNRFFQNAWKKYGEENFSFEILANCSTEWCLAMEQIHINKNKSAMRDFGYNLSPTAGSALGVKHSPEANKRNSERQIGKKMSPEWTESMRAAWKRRLSDPVTRQKIVSEFKAVIHSPEVKERANIGKRKYWKNPKSSHVEKLNAWRKSDGLKEMASLTHKGVRKSPEHRAKIGAAHVGMKRSEEAKRKMSESAKKRCASPDGKIQMRNAGLASHGKPMEPYN